LQGQFFQGLISGESYEKIAERVKRVTHKNHHDSVRIARTEGNRIQNQARHDLYDDALERLGIQMDKKWISTDDYRTRKHHVDADGQTVGHDESFLVGGELLKYPGDENASARNVINCRCTTVPILKKDLPKIKEAENV
jgi:hypothetical protein